MSPSIRHGVVVMGLGLAVAAAGTVYRVGRDAAPDKLAARHAAHADEAEREGRYDEPEAFVRFWEARREGTGSRSPAQVNIDAENLLRAQQGSQPPAWGFEELGPGNFGGRSRGVLVDPNNPNRLLFSSVSGGFWRSTDGGQSWQVVGDFAPNLAIGSLVQDPDNASRVFAGTGEGFFNGDAARGAGILRSDDFGGTWTQLPNTANPDFFWVNRLAMVPGTDVIVAATRSGLWRSTNLGADWTRVATDLIVDNRGYTDVKTDPSTPTRLLASHFGSAGGLGPIPQIDVDGLPSIRGVQMGFGPPTPAGPLNAPLVLANDGSGTLTDACEPFAAGSLTGKTLLADRGNCAFTIKVTNAQTAGAVYVVIAQNVPDAPFAGSGSGSFTISSMMISQADGNALKQAIAGTVPGIVFRNGFENPPAVPEVPSAISGPQLLTNYLVRSTDGGATWTQLSANGLPNSNIGRSEVAWGTGGVAYAAFSTSGDTTRGLWRSIDGGLNWTQTASATAFIERQGWYDLAAAVAPNNNNRVYLGAVDQYLTNDGGATITRNTFWNPGTGQMPVYVHADHHAYTFAPGSPNTIYTGSDGGVHVSTDAGVTYRELNFGLNASMPNNISVSPNGRVVTGTQDNGSHLSFGADDQVWIEWSGGDGGNTAADQQDSNFFYSSRPNGDFFGTSTAGNTESDLPLAVLGTNANSLFYAPIAIDPNDGNRLLVGVAGAQFSANARSLATSTYTQIVMPGAFGAFTNSLTISPLDGTVAYAGSTTGAIVRITGLGTTNTVTSIQGNLPVGNDVSQILVDRTDGNHLYVVLADYGTNRVWETLNGGASWTSLHGTLPDVPMFSIAQVPGSNDLLVGSEIGLWYGDRTAPGTPDWSRFDYGIPHARVTGMTIAGGQVYFAVYGRSNFKGTLSPLRVALADLRNDSGCDADGNLDEGETADLPVTVRNLSNQALGSILLSITSSNPANGLIAPVIIPSLGANASTIVTVPLSMAASATCPDAASLTATAALGTTTSVATRSYALDVQTPALTSLVDGAESPSSLLSATHTLGADDWVRVTTLPNSGSFAWFAANNPSLSEKSLTSPWVDVTSAAASLAFALRYDTEGDASQRWDGVVLEVRTRANPDTAPGRWIDIGGSSTVAYDGLSFFNTALGPARPLWSGTQTSWRLATAPLGSFNGSQLQFRFRFVSDAAVGVTGFWLDDIAATGISVRSLPTCDAACN